MRQTEAVSSSLRRGVGVMSVNKSSIREKDCKSSDEKAFQKKPASLEEGKTLLISSDGYVQRSFCISHRPRLNMLGRRSIHGRGTHVFHHTRACRMHTPGRQDKASDPRSYNHLRVHMQHAG